MRQNKRITYIVMLVLILTAVIYLIKEKKENPPKTVQENEILNDGDTLINKNALLVLGDEKIISPDTLPKGATIAQGDVEIIKINEHELIYTHSSQHEKLPVSASFYNTLKTSPSTRYQFSLPDGTQIWMNSGSSITFPLNINANHSIFLISGEVFMEISKHQEETITVRTDDGTVVLINKPGTSVNINAYKKNNHVMTTIVRGKALISKREYSMHLMDGEQSFTDLSAAKKNPNSKQEVNTRAVIGWKN